jgi:hypothetical protein
METHHKFALMLSLLWLPLAAIADSKLRMPLDQVHIDAKDIATGMPFCSKTGIGS